MMSPRRFDRLVVVDGSRVEEDAGPALRDHLGRLLHDQTTIDDRVHVDVPAPPPEVEALLALLDRALHAQLTRPVTEPDGWQAFVAFSEEVAERALEHVDEGQTLLYLRGAALLLVPEIVRRRHPEVTVTLRLSAPWPAPELFARLPWRRGLLAGAAGADVLSVPAERDRKNLARTFGRYAEDVGVAARKGVLMLADGRRVRTIANPPGIDVPATLALGATDAADEEAALWRDRLGDREMVLTVERLHASSGLLEQLSAIEHLLTSRPELAERLTFVVVAFEAPGGSTGTRRHIEATVGRINGRFTRPGGAVPLHYLHGGLEDHGLAALYRLAHVLIVTPLLAAATPAAKEYVAFQGDRAGRGRLLMSETSGTATELRQVRTCNPFDLDAIADGIAEAAERDPVQAERDLAAMARTTRRHDVHAWWQRELAFAADPMTEDAPRPPRTS